MKNQEKTTPEFTLLQGIMLVCLIIFNPLKLEGQGVTIPTPCTINVRTISSFPLFEGNQFTLHLLNSELGLTKLTKPQSDAQSP